MSDFIEKSKLIHGAKYDYSATVYKNRYTKVKIGCSIHGVFEQIPRSHLEGIGCKKCHFDNRTKKLDDFVKCAKLKHGDLYDYSNTIYINSEQKVKIGCKHHGIFEQRPRDHLSGSGCRRCAQHSIGRMLADDKESFTAKAIAKHGDRYNYSDINYVNSDTHVDIVCKKHGVFPCTPTNHLQGTGCPKCKESKGEKYIADFLTANKIKFTREYKFPNSLYRYDFYLPDQNILIEFHGEQHYRAVDYFGGVEAFENTLANDEAKIILARDFDVPLLTFSYRYLELGTLDRGLMTSLTEIYRYWLEIEGEVKVFKRLPELCAYLGIQKIPFERLVFEYIGDKYPEVRKIF